MCVSCWIKHGYGNTSLFSSDFKDNRWNTCAQNHTRPPSSMSIFIHDSFFAFHLWSTSSSVFVSFFLQYSHTHTGTGTYTFKLRHMYRYVQVHKREKKCKWFFIFLITLTDELIHGRPYFLFSLTQPATWFEFLMFPIKIIISFLLIYPSFADTLHSKACGMSWWNCSLLVWWILIRLKRYGLTLLPSTVSCVPIKILVFVSKLEKKKKTAPTLAFIRLTSHSNWNQIYWYSTEVILFTQCNTNILTYRWGQMCCS